MKILDRNGPCVDVADDTPGIHPRLVAAYVQATSCVLPPSESNHNKSISLSLALTIAVKGEEFSVNFWTRKAGPKKPL